MTNSADGKPRFRPNDNIISLADQQTTGPKKIRSIGTSRYQKTNHRTATIQVTFNRKELNEILRIYGFKVAAGEWRDYAIDHLRERAVFSIFRKASEVPLYQIEKNPRLASKQGMYSITGAAGHVLKRGQDLHQVLRVFDKKPKLKVL